MWCVDVCLRVRVRARWWCAWRQVIANPAVGFVGFTGSVAGGRSVYKTVASKRFIDATLELGGKDAAYICNDADFDAAVDTVVDGAFYNAGQSCCAVERVYVHRYVRQAGRGVSIEAVWLGMCGHRDCRLRVPCGGHATLAWRQIALQALSGCCQDND